MKISSVHDVKVTQCAGSTTRVAHELVAVRWVSVVADGVAYELRPGGTLTAMLVPGMTHDRTVLALRRGPVGPWLQIGTDGLSHAVAVDADGRTALRRVWGPALSARQLERAPGFTG